MLADGGDCLSDLGALHDQEDLFGRVASQATAFRVIESLAQEGMLERLRAARARARERAWGLGAKPERLVFDLDATLITSHSDKESAAGNYKGGFGFHPMLCYQVAARALLPLGRAARRGAQAHQGAAGPGTALTPGACGDDDLPGGRQGRSAGPCASAARETGRPASAGTYPPPLTLRLRISPHRTTRPCSPASLATG